MRKKRHNRPRVSAAAREARRVRDKKVEQKPASAADLARLGKYGGEEARAANEKRLQKRLIGASDGTVYYRTPHGQMVKTSGKAAVRPDGTLRPLPPEPRPSKRERAKARRLLKRREQ